MNILKKMPHNKPLTAVTLVLLALLALGLWAWRRPREIPYSTLLDRVEHGQIRQVEIQDGWITAEISAAGQAAGAPRRVRAYATDDPGLLSRLIRRGVAVRSRPPGPASWLGTAFFLGVVALMALVCGFLLGSRAAAGGGQDALAVFRKSPGEKGNGVRTTFRDVAGYPREKQELMELVDYLREPQVFRELGAEVPRTVLLVGPPGTGKTLLARAVAGTAGVKVTHVSGSAFVEMLVGVGAGRVRKLFEEARQEKKAVLFIDEVDVLARRRSSSPASSHPESDQTLNQLLIELDGFIREEERESRSVILFIAATNREDLLDPAFLQRMKRRIEVGLPTAAEREEILRTHAAGRPFVWDDGEIRETAVRAAGFSGRELANLLHEAGRQARLRLLESGRAERPAGGNAPKTICFADVTRALDRLGATVPRLEDCAAIEEGLGKRIAGQPYARRTLASLAMLHYSQARHNLESRRAERPPASALLIGPAGTGKARLAAALAEHLGVPFARHDLSLSAVHDPEGMARAVARRLLEAAGGTVQKARYGVVALCGLDRVLTGRESLAGDFVQEGICALLAGPRVEVAGGPAGGSVLVDLRGVLYVLTGSFDRLLGLVRERTGGADLPRHELLARAEPADWQALGLLPELLDRVLGVPLDDLGKEEVLASLDRKWSGNLVEGMREILRLHGIEADLSEGGREEIAQDVLRSGRGLQRLQDDLSRIALFLIAQNRDRSLASVMVNAALVRAALGLRQDDRPPEDWINLAEPHSAGEWRQILCEEAAV
jgi:ATP-dependent Zn protease